MSEIQSIAQNNYILHNVDAKKLYVQEPLFTANSGDAVYVGWRPDETVLYSATPSETKITSLTLSENPYNFAEIKVMYGNYGSTDGGNNMLCSLSFVPGANRNSDIVLFGTMRGGPSIYYDCIDEWSGVNTTAWSWVNGRICQFGTSSVQTNNNKWCNPYKVIGINRISGGNS